MKTLLLIIILVTVGCGREPEPVQVQTETPQGHGPTIHYQSECPDTYQLIQSTSLFGAFCYCQPPDNSASVECSDLSEN